MWCQVTNCDLKVQTSPFVVHANTWAGYRPVMFGTCAGSRAKTSLSPSYAPDYPLVSLVGSRCNIWYSRNSEIWNKWPGFKSWLYLLVSPSCLNPPGFSYSLHLAYGLLGRLKKTVQQFLSCELQTPGHLWPYYKRSEKADTREKESFRDLRLKSGIKSSRFKQWFYHRNKLLTLS